MPVYFPGGGLPAGQKAVGYEPDSAGQSGEFIVGGQKSGWRLGSDAQHEFHLNDSRRSKGGVIGTAGKPVISFRCDHGVDHFLSTFFPLFEARQLPVSLGVVTGTIGNPADPYEPNSTTWAQLKDAAARGIEIWSHSHTHRDPLIAGTDIKTEITESKRLIESAGLRCCGWQQPGINGCGYPHYSTNFVNPDSWPSDYGGQLWTDYGLIEMGGTVGGAYRALPTFGAADIGHTTVDPMTRPQSIAIVDNCIKYALSSQIMFHAKFIAIGTVAFTVQDFTALLDYVAEKRDAGLIEVLTASGLNWADPNSSRRLNVLADSSFDSGILPATAGSPWLRVASGDNVIVMDDGTAHSGRYYIRQPSAAAGYIYQGYGGVQNLRLQGSTMCAEAWVRCTGSDSEARLRVQCDSGATLNLDRFWTVTAGSGWKRLRSIFTLPVNAASVSVQLSRKAGSGVLDWDDATISPI